MIYLRKRLNHAKKTGHSFQKSKRTISQGEKPMCANKNV